MTEYDDAPIGQPDEHDPLWDEDYLARGLRQVQVEEIRQIAPSDADYFAAKGFSNSAMKDLAVSPLRFWHLHINPNRPAERVTPEMIFGTALHCAVLQPGCYSERYACEIDESDFPGCLRTMDDLRGWLREHSLPVSGKHKSELVERVTAADASVPILEVLQERYDAMTEGKIRLSKGDWLRVESAAAALRSEPNLMRIINDSQGSAEISMFATDPETGVLLKSKMDFITPSITVDLKTFSQTRGNSIDKSVTNAIFYERYHWQAFFYATVRSLQAGDKRISAPQMAPTHVLAFVESEEPHEVRIRSIRPKVGGEVNLLWERARLEVRGLIRTYAEFMNRFGERPWRSERDVDPLVDEEIPQLAYS